ncbi:hypothetical protein FDK38_001239 [Candidozyma auris]|nr:hypothetical protein FDK38_001239 [[Candida] auris]
MQLPPPPSLKTTIIQLNKDIDPEDNNYEILNNVYNTSSSGVSPSIAAVASTTEQPKKKRRRSSSFVDDDELARRKNETKQLHSIIEKRRRVKINREFEALKYIIPACRNTDNTAKKNSSSNNGSKIDGMYKLTILKSSVEYILYLHHIIQKQHELLSQNVKDYSYDTSFTQVPIDVNQYRNIDKDFHFSDLAAPTPKSSNSTCESIKEDNEDEPAQNRPAVGTLQRDQEKSSPAPPLISRKSSSDEEQLPSPDSTPDIAPLLSLLGKYSGDQKSAFAQQQVQLQKSLGRFSSMDQLDQVNKSFSYSTSQTRSGSVSSATSPFTIPIKSNTKKASFVLPDPAIPTSAPVPSNEESPESTTSYPKRLYFKSRVPANNMTAHIGATCEYEVDSSSEDGKLEDASKTLLLLRKPSIEKLLN